MYRYSVQSKKKRYLIPVLSFLLLCFLPVTAFTANNINKEFIREIGGVKQAIVIRGANIENPVLLRLHGGPGYPYFPYLPKDGKMKDLEDHFTMIYWEQRGTGASYSAKIKNKSMNTQQFVDDAYEVIQFARKLLHVDKVYIWGHSWGSNIGILLAYQHPEVIYAYVGTGQSVNVIRNERRCYRYALKKTYSDKNFHAYKKLLKIDTANYNLKDALKVRRWIFTYGGVVFSNGEERPYVDENILKKVWHTPQYKLKDKINILLHPFYSGRQLWDDMKDINLFEEAPVIKVPVYFCLGRHDNIVSSKIAADYFNVLKDPAGKELIWFENSAHRPFAEEPEKFFNVLVNKMIPETKSRIPSFETSGNTK